MTAINTHSAGIYRYSGLMAVGELVRFLAAKNKASNKHLPYMCHPQGICAPITIRQIMTFPLRRCKDMQKILNHQIFLYKFIFHRLNTGFFLQAALRYTLPSPHSAIVSRASAREESTPSLRCSLFRPSVPLLPPLSSPPFLPPRSSPSFFPPCLSALLVRRRFHAKRSTAPY